MRTIDLASLTMSVWETLFGPDLSAASDFDSSAADSVHAMVGVGSSPCNAVVVSCSPSLGRRIAAAMFGLRPADATEQDVDDALGEVANIIGGTVKAAADLDCDLSLPSVSRGGGLPDRLGKLATIQTAGFESGGERLGVAVLG